MKSRLLALAVLALTVACESTRQPMAPSVPAGPSASISDGANGGNPDFFFLPPVLRSPVNDPNYEAGKFNSTLGPSLTVEVCELQTAPIDAQGAPVATDCIAGAPRTKFAAGSVRLQNPPDGFYQVVWHTKDSNLDPAKYYRIKVLIDGKTPFGFADVDPVATMKEFRNARTGEVIPLNADGTLPINFRIEKGGGPTLCGGATLCGSSTITNDNPTGEVQVVQVQGNNGPVAGVVIPDGWLPPGGPQSVVVTINSVNTGVNNLTNGTQQFPCHANLNLQQFNGCFNFSTVPALAPIADGHEFAQPVTVVVCYVLHDTEDAREPYAQLFSSGPNEPAHPLVSVSDALVLTAPTEHACGTNFNTVLLSNASWSSKLTQLASLGWRKVTGGIGHVLGVKTAYAVDLGLGGLSLDFSNVGPAINAHMTTGEFNPDFAVSPGSTTTLVARTVGTQKHDASALSTGIPDYPVTFALGTPDAGGFRAVGSQDPLATSFTMPTNSALIFPGSAGSGGGFATVDWVAPNTPGNYTLTATSPYAIGTITYHVTVAPPLSSLQGAWQNENANTANLVSISFGVEGSTVTVGAFGQCAPTDCDWGATQGDASLWNAQQQITAVWDQGFAVKTVTIKRLSATRLEGTTHAAFAPGDGRTDYTVTEFFQPAPVIN